MSKGGNALAPSTHDDNVAAARLRRDREAGERIAAVADLVGRQLASMSRAPFRALLLEMIGAAPTPEAIRRFADKYPDRWAQAVSILAGLSGFDRGVVEVNVFNIKGLSDAELMRRLDELEAQRPQAVGTLGSPAVDAVIVNETPRIVNPEGDKAREIKELGVVGDSAAAFGGGAPAP